MCVLKMIRTLLLVRSLTISGRGGGTRGET